MKYPGFIGGSYGSQAVTADQERTVNWYVEKMESPGATARSVLYPTPGVEQLTTFEVTQGRAHFYNDGREFVVVGTALLEIDEDGVATFRGTVAIDTNPATISSNGDGGGELFITSGGNGYCYTLATDTLTQITALNGKATMGDALDGYFLALDANTGTMYASELLDGTTWTTGTMFAQRNAAPDPWVSMKVLGAYIWLLGEHTSEVWYDAGSSPFPFAKHPSGLVQYGISAPFSAAVCDTSLVWLGSSKGGRGFVLRTTGFSPEIVSTYPVNFALGGYSIISDGYGDSYTEAGHTFYCLGLPTANVTWCWDLTTSQWHERATWLPADNAYSIWRLRCHAFAFGEHRWLDYQRGAIYRASIEFGSDVTGLAIRRMRRAPAVFSENERIYFSAFELDLEPGLGLVSGQGVNPMVMLRTSNDGGKTWGAERMRSAGRMGEYGKRVRWERCGSARRRVFEVTVSDPVPWRLTNAYLTLGQGVQTGQRGAA